MKLYDIKEKYREILERFKENGDVDDLQERFSSVKGNYINKLSNIAYAIKEIEKEVEVLKDHERNTRSKRKSRLSKISSLKSVIMEGMRELNVSNIKTPHATVFTSKNPPKIIVEAKEAIPEEFVETVISKKVNKKKIKEALQNGKEVPGCKLVQDESVKIRG